MQETRNMMFEKSKGILVRVISVAILSAGFAQVSWAGTIDTSYMIEADAHATSLNNIQTLLAQEEFAVQLQKMGVHRSDIDERLQGMTVSELAALEGQIDQNIAGGDALATIGIVFIVILILELVGITDVFKSI
jgi:hypothetical protein